MKYVTFIIAVAAIAFCTFKYGRTYEALQNEKAKQTADSTAIVILQRQMAEISELATVSYNYTELTKHQKSQTLWNIKLPFSTSTYLIQHSGTIKAGVDLSKARITVRDTTIFIYIPKAKILSHDIDPNSLKIISKDESIFTTISIEDFNKFNIANRDSMEREAVRSGLLGAAHNRVAESLSLLTAPLIANGYCVIYQPLEVFYKEGNYLENRRE